VIVVRVGEWVIFRKTAFGQLVVARHIGRSGVLKVEHQVNILMWFEARFLSQVKSPVCRTNLSEWIIIEQNSVAVIYLCSIKFTLTIAVGMVAVLQN